MGYRDEYRRWMDRIQNPCLAEELKNMGERDIEDAFCRELSFGPGGLRAIMGAGTNRMNAITVAKASQGVANYLIRHFGKPSVAIAYDTRHHSQEFALKAASVFERNGIRALAFPEPVPTPLLSYAVRSLGCSAGIAITASHNSKEYNGYKVYDSDGCQITDRAAQEIQGEISQADIRGRR